MFGDWIYYPAIILLLVANLASWAGNFYRLQGNWLIVANSTLFLCLLPPTELGLGVSWFSICLIIALAVLGDAFNYASKRHQIFSAEANPPVRQRVLVGAGIGSLTCVLAGMSVPIIGSLLAVIGAVGGAAGGAWLGAVISPYQQSFHTELSKTSPLTSSQPAHKRLSRFLTDQQIRLIPKLLAGFMMMIVIAYSSLF